MSLHTIANRDGLVPSRLGCTIPNFCQAAERFCACFFFFICYLHFRTSLWPDCDLAGWLQEPIKEEKED